MQIQKQELGNAYAFLDPSGGKNQVIKRVAARSAIVVAVEGPKNLLFVPYAWAAKCTTDQLTEKVFEVNRQFHPRLFGVEANAMQSLYVDSLIREARRDRINIRLSGVYQPTHIEKTFRIRTTLQPWFSHGRIIIRDDLLELRNELMSFPTGALRDLVDALASVVSIMPPRDGGTSADDCELQALADYLRQCGYGPDAILRRIMEVRAERSGDDFNIARYLRERGNQHGV